VRIVGLEREFYPDKIPSMDIKKGNNHQIKTSKCVKNPMPRLINKIMRIIARIR